MNGIKRFTLRLSFLLALLLAFATACKDQVNSSIPYVKFTTPISLANNNGLNIPANPLYFNGGYGGIIVIYTGFSYDAFDITCPYEVSGQCKINTDGDIIATCPCCGTQYNLMTGGSVMAGTGPGTEPLKPYSVTQSAGYLYVSN